MMESLLAHSTDMLAWVAPDGRIRTASRPLLARWRLDNDALCRHQLADLLSPAGVETFSRQGLVKVCRKGGISELQVLCWPGTDRQEEALLTIVVQFDPFGVEQGLLCQFTFAATPPAATAIKGFQTSDNFFKTVLNSISDAVLILDAASMQVLAANTAFLVESGQREDEVIGKSCQAVAHGGTFAFMLTSGICPLLETVSQERTAVAEHVYREGGKPVRVFEISTSPVRDTNGKVAQVVHVSRDVTARRRFEEEVRGLARRLAQSNAELQQANEDIKNFAYIVSHDMRAPLVSIKGFAVELLTALHELKRFVAEQPQISDEARTWLDTLLEQDVAESVNFITSAASRLDGMIAAILQLARLGYREFVPENLDLDELVRGILASLAHQLEQKQVTVERGPLPVISADRMAISQIFGNLLDNAVKYLEPGRPGRVAITAERTTDQIVFRIQDNGRGISPQDREKVFDLFKRVGKPDVAGDGMGLAYVKTLVRRLGGQIWCESAAGDGTTFYWSLPLTLPRLENPTPAGE